MVHFLHTVTNGTKLRKGKISQTTSQELYTAETFIHIIRVCCPVMQVRRSKIFDDGKMRKLDIVILIVRYQGSKDFEKTHVGAHFLPSVELLILWVESNCVPQLAQFHRSFTAYQPHECFPRNVLSTPYTSDSIKNPLVRTRKPRRKCVEGSLHVEYTFLFSEMVQLTLDPSKPALFSMP